jgi:hypothetical protein
MSRNISEFTCTENTGSNPTRGTNVFLCFSCPLHVVEALRWFIPQPKETYQICKRFTLSESNSKLNWARRTNL